MVRVHKPIFFPVAQKVIVIVSAIVKFSIVIVMVNLHFSLGHCLRWSTPFPQDQHTCKLGKLACTFYGGLVSSKGGYLSIF